MKKFCVTGINRLTREREVLTPPCSRENAYKILERQKMIPARKCAYTYLRLEIYPPSATCA